MNEEYLKSLYEYLVSTDPSFADDLDPNGFIESMGDNKYAAQIYGFLTDKDPSFRFDVDVKSFLESIRSPKKKDESAMGSTLEDGSLASPEGAEPKPKFGEGTNINDYGYIDPVKQLGMYPEGGQERVLSAFKQRGADIKTTLLEEEAQRPALAQQKMVEAGVGQSAEEMRLKNEQERQALIQSPDFETALKNTDEFSMDLSEEDAVGYFTGLYGKYGFIFRETGIGDALEVVAPDGSKRTVDLQTFFSNYYEASRLRSFLKAKARKPLDPINADEQTEIDNAMRAKNMRKTARINNDGTESTVKFEQAEIDGKYVVYPTLFPKKEFASTYGSSPYYWEEKKGMEAYETALSRGEVFTFSNLEDSLEFAEGSWKEISTADAEAMDFYKKRGLDYNAYRQQFNRYEEIKDIIEVLESGPYREENLTPEQKEKYSGVYYLNGIKRTDSQEVIAELEKEAANLRELVNDSEYRRTREDFDLYIDKEFRVKAKDAIVANIQAKDAMNMVQQQSLANFGVMAEDLDKITPPPGQEQLFDNLNTLYKDAKSVQQQAANKYEVSNTYLNVKADKQARSMYVDNWQSVSNAWTTGWGRGNVGNEILKLSLGLKDVDDDADVEEVAAAVIKYMQDSETGKIGRTQYRYHQAKGFLEVWDIFKDDPLELATSLAAESMSQMLPYGWKILAGSTVTGAGAGFALGGPAGALRGGAQGFRSGFAMTSLALEYTNAVMDAVKNKGYNAMDPTELKQALQDETVWDEGREIGLKRGIPIAMADYFGAKLAGRVFKTGSLTSRTRRVASGAVERTVFDPAVEAGGEYAAMLSAGQEISVKEIMAEAIGGFGNNTSTAAVNVYLDARTRNNADLANQFTDVKILAREGSSDTKISSWANNMERLGQISPEQNQRIQQNVGLRREARDMLNVGSRGDVFSSTNSRALEGRLMELLAAREELTSTPNRQSVFSGKISEINNEISEIVTTKSLRPAEQQTLLAGQGVITAQEQESATDVRPGIQKYTINGKALTREEFLQQLENMNDRRLLKSTITVDNDDEVSNIVKQNIDAIQKPETRNIPDAQPTGTVQEVETEVREPVVEEAIQEEVTPVVEETQTQATPFKTGETIQKEDLTQEDLFTHQTKSEDAIVNWANSGQVVGKNESLEEFDARVPVTLTEKGQKMGMNRQSPNFQKGGLYSGKVNKGVKFVVVAKGEQAFIPSDRFTNVESFEQSKGISTLKPEARDISNFDVYSVNEDGSLTKRDWSEFKTEPELTQEEQDLMSLVDQKQPETKPVKPVKKTKKKEADTKEEPVTITKKPKPKPIDTTAEDIAMFESDIETYAMEIENLQEEIEIEKSNLKEGLAEIDAKIKEIRGSKRNRETKVELIEELRAEKEDLKDEQESLIDNYKQDIKAIKSDSRKAERKLKKLQAKPKVDFRKKSKEEIDQEFGPSQDEVQDITRQMNAMSSGNVATSVESKTKQRIDINELNSRTDKPIKTVRMEVVKGIPTIFTISDQLTTGNVVNPNTQNTIVDLKGGLGFTGTIGNENAAWANTSEAEATDVYNKAQKVYQDNKQVFDSWWKANPEYNGLVPMNVVKMGEGSLLSNEATFRVLADNMTKIPEANKQKALEVLRTQLESDSKTKQERIDSGKLSQNTQRAYGKAIKSNNETLALLEGLTSIDQAITEEKIQQLNLPSRRLLLEKIGYGNANRSGQKVKPGTPSTPVTQALLEGMSKEDRALVHIGEITDIITDNQMKNVPQRSIVAIQGVDVLNGGVIETNHPNYPYGVKGKTIGVLEESVAIQDVYPTAFNNALVGLTKAEEKPRTATKRQAEQSKGAVQEGDLMPSSIGTILTETIGVQNGLPGLEFIGAITQGDVSNMNKLTAFMNTAFPSVNISTDPTTFNNVMNSEGVKVYLKGNEVVYGVTVDGDIYINPDVHNSESAMFNTAIHEMGHVWTDYLQTTKQGREIYEKGAALAQQTEEYQKQLRIFNGDVKAATNETIAILIGNKGQTITEASLKSKFTEWLLGMWKFIKDQFKMSKDLSPEEIQNMTLDQFLGTALADIFSGKEVQMTDAQMKQLKNPEAAFSKSQSIDSIVELGRMNGFSDQSIRTVLKQKGFKASDINAALEVTLDNTVMPREFGNVEGGANVGKTLFENVKSKLNNKEKSFAEIRQDAQNILKADPIYQSQPEQTQMELRLALDRSLGIRHNPNVTREIGQIRNDLKQRKIGAKDLADAQRKLRMFARKALPKSTSYSNAAINRIVKTINETTAQNFDAQAMKILNEVEAQRNVLKGQVIKKIIREVKDKSKTAATSSKRRRSAGLDAIGQAYFAEAKRVLQYAIDGNINELTKLQQGIDEAALSEAIDRAERGENLTRDEHIMMDQQIALDSFADVATMSLEDVVQLLADVKKTKAESIARLNNRRELRRQEVNALKTDFNQQITNDYSQLYDAEGNPLSQDQLRVQRDSVRQAFKDKGLTAGVMQFFKKFMSNEKLDGNKLSKFFQQNMMHLGTFTNILDRGKQGMFTEVFYERLNDMDENYLTGTFRQEDKLNAMTQAISDKDYAKWKYSLGNDTINLEGIKSGLENNSQQTYTRPLNKDQAMRIYALSLNPVQAQKLENQGFDSANMQRIKDFIGPDNMAMVEQTVDYLSNEYYNEVNDVFVQANDVNLGYVENYFPTRTIAQNQVVQDLVNGDFSKIFTADTAPALQERTNVKGDVDIAFSFTETLEEHFKSMERYKAYAVGVKQMNEVYKSPDIQGLLQATGLGPIFRQSLNYAINPDSGPKPSSGIVSYIQRNFTGFALALKAIQIVKQATSFVQAFEDYSFRSNKPTPVLDHVMFAYDYAKVIATLPSQIKKASEMSATFKNRIRLGVQGDVFGLESGGRASRTFTSLMSDRSLKGKMARAAKQVAAFPTVAGDILGVLGYMANYNRNIENGMSKAEALRLFNKYNVTQQTRRSTEKIGLQQDTSMAARFFTMFGSTLYLQMNKVMQSSNNIINSFNPRKGEFGNAKDYRALYLNYAVANVLFTAASYAGVFLNGDDEDKARAWRALRDAATGANLIYQVPIIGAGIEFAVGQLSGDRKPISEGVNPVTAVARKMIKAAKETSDGNVAKATKPILEILIGAQLDAPIALAKIFTGQGDTEDFYDAVGISPSYRPGYGNKKKSKPKRREMTQKEMKEMLPDLYKEIYGKKN